MHGQRPPPEPVARGARLPAVAVGLLGPWQRCGQQLLMGRHPALPVVIVRCVGHEASDVHTRAVTARSGRSVSRPDLHERAVAPSSEPLHLRHLSPQGDHYAGTVRLARHGHHARHATAHHARTRRRGRDNYTGVEGHGSQRLRGWENERHGTEKKRTRGWKASEAKARKVGSSLIKEVITQKQKQKRAAQRCVLPTLHISRQLYFSSDESAQSRPMRRA